MNYQDTFDEHELVNNWLETLGMPSGHHFQLDEDGVCSIGHSNGIECTIETPEACGKVYLRAPLTRFDGPGDPILHYCMASHLLGIQTSGALFATDPEDQTLVLWQARELATLNPETFAIMVVDFLETAEHWRDKLMNVPRGSADSVFTDNPATLDYSLKRA